MQGLLRTKYCLGWKQKQWRPAPAKTEKTEKAIEILSYLSLWKRQLLRQLWLPLDCNVACKVELFLQLHPLHLSVHHAVLVFGSRFACHWEEEKKKKKKVSINRKRSTRGKRVAASRKEGSSKLCVLPSHLAVVVVVVTQCEHYFSNRDRLNRRQASKWAAAAAAEKRAFKRVPESSFTRSRAPSEHW